MASSERNTQNSGGFYGAFTSHCIRHRWWWLAAILLITVFFGTQMKNVAFDNSSDIWFVEGHESLLNKARFDATFGNDEFVFLLFTNEKTPFTPANFKALAALANQLDNETPYAREVTWLGNVERIRGLEADHQEILIEDFLADLPATQHAVQASIEEALTEPDFVNNLVSEDGAVLTMVVDLDTYPPDDDNPRYTVAKAVNNILADPQYETLKPYIAGGPHFSFNYDKLAQRQTATLFSMVVLVMAVLLFWLGRGLRGVVVPLAVTILAVFWTIGSIGLLGFTMNLLSIALPTMLLCVGIGDSIHGIASYHDHVDKGLQRHQALRAAFSEVGRPIMLTSLTTAAGFLAYLATHVKPYREMGVYVALGVTFAFILSVILTPILYSFGAPNPKRRAVRSHAKAKGDLFDRWLAFTYRIVTTRTKSILVIFGVIMAITITGYFMVQVESNYSRLVLKREPLRQTLDIIDARLGSALNLEFLIDTKKEGGVKDPVFLAKVDELMAYAEAHPLVTKAVSVTDVIKKMRRALHGNNMDYYTLPESREALAQYFFLYETSGGSTLDRQVGFLYDVVRLSLKTRSLDTAQARTLEHDIRAKAADIFTNDDIELVESGSMFRYIALNDILYSGQRSSLLMAMTVITIIMMLVLRSVKLGLISMAPNVFPVFVTLGFMGLAGFYLDVITISFAAVIIGVAVDDTIHFLTRFRKEFHLHGNYNAALWETLRSVGRPLTFTSLILVVGNAVFITSSLLGFLKLGILFGVAFTWALLADFYVSPALILLFKPLGPERNPSSQSTSEGVSHA